MGFVLVFRRYAPFSKFGFGFEGDNRTAASVSMQATARTIGIVPFGPGHIGSLASSSSGTEFLGGGAWLRGVLGKHMSSVTSTETNKQTGPNFVSFTASTAGSNPMMGVVAPAIDTFIDFRAQWMPGSVHFVGAVRGDNFPNAEVFVLDQNGRGCLLFDGRTSGGQNTGPMTRLAGGHAKQVLGTFAISMSLTAAGVFLAPGTQRPITKM